MCEGHKPQNNILGGQPHPFIHTVFLLYCIAFQIIRFKCKKIHDLGLWIKVFILEILFIFFTKKGYLLVKGILK